MLGRRRNAPRPAVRGEGARRDSGGRVRGMALTLTGSLSLATLSRKREPELDEARRE
jgi:hypothetical protein